MQLQQARQLRYRIGRYQYQADISIRQITTNRQITTTHNYQAELDFVRQIQSAWGIGCKHSSHAPQPTYQKSKTRYR